MTGTGVGIVNVVLSAVQAITGLIALWLLSLKKNRDR